MPPAAEHFVGPPHWEWYILGYFLFAGLSGGSYALAALLRHWGTGRDEAAARLGFLVAFPAVLICPVLLTLDLGQPLRFWHMLVNTTPGEIGLNFSSWSPMSVGAWALLVYGIFPTVSFLQTLVRDGVLRWPVAVRLAGLLDLIDLPFTVIGAIFGLFVASYTGVLLSVSNQPIWSDTWALGGLFLASGLSGAAALLALLVRYRPAASASDDYLRAVDGYFVLLEVLLLLAFFVTIGLAGTLGMTLELPWVLLWVLVVLSLAPPLTHLVGGRMQLAGRATAALEATGVAVPALVLAGVVALRFAVIFSAQS